jgi:hypothetical protein
MWRTYGDQHPMDDGQEKIAMEGRGTGRRLPYNGVRGRLRAGAAGGSAAAPFHTQTWRHSPGRDGRYPALTRQTETAPLVQSIGLAAVAALEAESWELGVKARARAKGERAGL